MTKRILYSLLAFVLAGAPPAAAEVFAQAAAPIGAAKIGPSGLPLPRFVSLKSDRVNVRNGPGTDHAVTWVFSRAGLPVEVIAESGHWRRVRDSASSEGWVFRSLLSGRRTALVSPWVEDKTAVALYQSRSTSGDLVARLRPGVLVSVLSCNVTWCNISLDDYSGWIEQDKLWGVYGGETVK